LATSVESIHHKITSELSQPPSTAYQKISNVQAIIPASPGYRQLKVTSGLKTSASPQPGELHIKRSRWQRAQKTTMHKLWLAPPQIDSTTYHWLAKITSTLHITICGL